MPNVIPYSLFSEFDINLFKAGKHYRLYEKMGSHPMELNGEKGTYFAVWAPTARTVSVIGNFNDWQDGVHPLNVRWDASGIWEGFLPGICKGEIYKYKIHSENHGVVTEKADPFSRYCEHPPLNASIIACTFIPPFFRPPSSRLRPTPRRISLNNWIVLLSIIFRLRMLRPFNRLSEIKE